MRISDWSSDVCSSDLEPPIQAIQRKPELGGIMPPESVDFLLADFGRFRQFEPAMYPIAPVGVEAPADLPAFGHGARGHDGSFIVSKRRRHTGGKPGCRRSARRPQRDTMAKKDKRGGGQ